MKKNLLIFQQDMFTSLVLSGGSLQGVAMIGCLAYLEDIGYIHHIKRYIGTSFGSLLSFFAVLGYTSSRMCEIIESVLDNYPKREIDLTTIIQGYSNLGVDDGEYIIHQIRTALKERFDVDDITFVDLAKKTGKILVVTVANICKASTEYMSVDTEPELSVLKAIRMSVSIPFIMSPVIHKEYMYVDGGLYDNFPINYFNQRTNPLKDVLAICIENKDVRVDPAATLPKDPLSYTLLLLQSMLKRLNSREKVPESIDVIVIKLHRESGMFDYSLNTLSFGMSKSKIRELYKSGYDALLKVTDKIKQ